MKAIDNSNLVGGLCLGCDCTGFAPALSYELKNTATLKQVIITDASTFGAGDTLKKVLIHVYDASGKEVHGNFVAPAPATPVVPGSTTIDVSTLDLSNLTVLATVISDKGCKADLSIYNLGTTAVKGSMANTAKQGTRN